MALVVAFGTFAILRGQIKVGYFSILTNYAIWVLFALMMLATIMVMVAMSLASMKRVYEVLVEKSTIENNPNALKEIKMDRLNLEMSHLNIKMVMEMKS